MRIRTTQIGWVGGGLCKFYLLPFATGQSSKGNNRFLFPKTVLERLGNRLLQNLFPFVKLSEKCSGIFIHLKTVLFTTNKEVNILSFRARNQIFRKAVQVQCN